MVRTPHFPCRGHGCDPWLEKLPHAVQRSPPKRSVILRINPNTLLTRDVLIQLLLPERVDQKRLNIHLQIAGHRHQFPQKSLVNSELRRQGPHQPFCESSSSTCTQKALNKCLLLPSLPSFPYSQGHLLGPQRPQLCCAEGRAIAELKKKAEQKIAAIKKQLLSQMEEKEQQYRKDREIHILEEKLKSAESSPQSETSVVPRLSENVAVCTEQEEADSQGCVQNACEEKLGVLQRNLIEKEMLVQRLEQEKEEIISSRSEIQCKYQELLIKIEQAEAKQHEDRVMINQLQEELEGKNKKHSLVSSQHLEEGDKNNTGAKQNLENVVDNVQKTLQGEDLTCQILEQKIKELDSCLLNEREGHRIEIEELTSKLESLQALQQQMNGKSKPTEVLEESAEGKSTSHVVQPSLLSNMEADHNDLEFKLAGAEQEKQKLSQEVVKLQKDIRMLRKEHQQELDIIKKEYEKEMEEKIK